MSTERYDRMEKKLDDILEKVHSIDKTLISQHISLEHHIRRTDLLEDKVFGVEEEIKPLKQGVATIKGVFKLISFIGLAISMLVGVLKLLGKA